MPAVVVSDADYLATVAKAYLAAPPLSIEEVELGSVLSSACERLGVDRDDLLRRIIDQAYVEREAEIRG